MLMASSTDKFQLGHIVMTASISQILDAKPELRQEAFNILQRHVSGDWGELLEAGDRRLNDRALIDGSRIMSAYKLGDEKMWIITEADRSATTILLPEDY